MKRFLYLLLLSVITATGFAQPDPDYPLAPVAPQNITAAEYFIDTDPGPGNGTSITVAAAINIPSVGAVVNVNGLSNGLHRLYIRTRNATGQWSITNIKEFLYEADIIYAAAPAAAQNIVAAEYFIDTDPGFGNAVAISITPGLNISNLAITVNTTGLTNGIHRLYMRTKSNEGRWSLTSIREFSIDFEIAYPASPSAAQNIVAAEYFIDTDPGHGNAVAISITPGVNISNLVTAVNTAGLSNGIHRLYIRTKGNEGRWSLSSVRDFSVETSIAYPPALIAPQNIIRAEYFIDTDPGHGNATAISVTPGLDISNLVTAVNTTGLIIGIHRLYIRTKSNEGAWSLTSIRDFSIESSIAYPPAPPAPQNVVAAEYFVDTDPGHGNATAISITPGLDISSVPVTVNTTGLSDGIHRVHIRTKSQEGRWSITTIDTFRVGTFIAAWALDPATGHDYGNIQKNTSSNFNFTIRNTGNLPVILGSVSTGNPAFVPSFGANTVIPVNGSISLPVSFVPSVVGPYSAVLKIKSSGGPDSVTTLLTGNGFTLAIAPVLTFVSGSPFSGTSGVNPNVGQTGVYTYKVVYSSDDNRAPAAGYPQVGIDLNGDSDFDDFGEGRYTMTKEGNSINYAVGVVYTYSVNFSNYSNTLGYRFFAQDELGNNATILNAGYFPGPLITFQLLDLKLFANDISFSKNNPLPGETFTVTANITNNSAFAATNVPVRFYRDNTLLAGAVIPSVGAFSSAAVSTTLSFPADGFNPIKVWVDPDQTLGETNVLNNYAIRPVIVGNPVLPGGINVTAQASVQSCPLKLVFSGNAQYFGTSIPTSVAGAEVTINTGTQLLKTTTDANGNFSLLLENIACGNAMTYTVSVTDFTFTSNTFTGIVNIPCSPCTPPVAPSGGVNFAMVVSACANRVGNNATGDLRVKFRERDLSNFWNGWDGILDDTLKIFVDGVLTQTLTSANGSRVPGEVIVIPLHIPLTAPGSVNVEAKLSYVYNEFFQIPSAFYHGMMIPITTEATTSIAVESNLPDLTIKGFRQPTLGTIAFDEENIKCGDAGDHIVRVYDGSTIIFADTLTLAGGIGMHFFPTAQLAAGTHTIRIVSDEPNAVTESDESNNVFETTITVPEADLIVKSITPVSTNLPNGSSAKFQAVIRNLGTVAGPYTVRFTANGVQIGGLVSVTGTAEGGESTVFSDLFTLTTNSEDCPIIIEAFADAGSAITEVSESNNTLQIKLASDLDPSPTGSEFGTAGNPVRVRVNTPKVFNVYVRNIGTRDISNVNVKFFHNSQLIGEEVVPYIKARKEFPAVASFTHTFTAVGIQTVTIIADDANVVCESDETNNTGAYMVQVTDSKEDYEVLSQYISPSALNPDAGQSITIVGTVKNVGNRVAPPNILQFFVDNIKLGVDVPFNALQPGQDTTVQASVPYSSLIPGVKVMKIVTDPNNGVDEEAELNNEATRILIVGDAPDMKRASANAIRFNPSGFSEGDSVTVSYSVVNGGSQQGTAWVLFYIYDEGDAVVGLDSVQFTLAAGASTTVSRKMLFDVTKGMVIAQIVNCSPIEFDLFNNADTLAFSTVGQLKSNITVNGNLDMEAALQDQLPGWIGGKLMIGDYNLVVNGSIVNYDTAHFVITNGAGKLQLVNSNAENIFPVGTSLFSSNFMRLNNAGTPDNFSVRVVDHVLKNGTAGDTVRTGNVDRTWFIEEQVTGGSNATIELFWNASHELPSFDRSISRTAHYTTSWQLGTAGPAAVDAIGRFSKTQAGYSGFSPFTVTSDIGGALPLRFISFDATLVDNDVKLKWVTDNEVSTSHFEVEFSSNGAGYSAIGRVNAANTGGRHEYNYVDLSPAGTVLYYRIKQVDIDGRFTYSNVVRMDLQDDQKIVLYPNPASTVISLKNVNPAEVKTITITAIDGRTLLVMVPVSSMQYDIGHLRDGTYVVTIIWKDKRAESRQFIKVSR